MSDDTAKFEALAPGLRWTPKWVRQNMSAKVFWSILVSIVSGGFGTGVWVTRQLTQIDDLQKANATLQRSLEQQVQSIGKLSDGVNETKMQVAVLASEVHDIGQRVDEQQQKWDRAEEGAELKVPRLKVRKPIRR